MGQRLGVRTVPPFSYLEQYKDQALNKALNGQRELYVHRVVQHCHVQCPAWEVFFKELNLSGT